jgi:hypothetical protein
MKEAGENYTWSAVDQKPLQLGNRLYELCFELFCFFCGTLERSVTPLRIAAPVYVILNQGHHLQLHDLCSR